MTVSYGRRALPMPDALETEFIGRAYDDFLFRPQPGVAASRLGVSLRTRLSRRLSLELPVAAANMDTVTGIQMARAMAFGGGIGFVHRGMSIAAQADSVARVKRTHGHIVVGDEFDDTPSLTAHRVNGLDVDPGIVQNTAELGEGAGLVLEDDTKLGCHRLLRG